MVAITSIALLSCSKSDIVPNQTIQSTNIAPCNGKRTASVQCTGTTQSGKRCQNKTLSCNSKCYLHGGN
jgi:hypothetical protein